MVSRTVRRFVQETSYSFRRRERLHSWLTVRRPHRVALSTSARDPIMLASPPLFVSETARAADGGGGKDVLDLYMVTKDCAAKFRNFCLLSYHDWSNASADGDCELFWTSQELIFVIRSTTSDSGNGGGGFLLSAIRKEDFKMTEEKSLPSLDRVVLESMRSVDEIPIHGSLRGSLEAGGGLPVAWSPRPLRLVAGCETPAEVAEKIQFFSRVVRSLRQEHDCRELHHFSFAQQYCVVLTVWPRPTLVCYQLSPLEKKWTKSVGNAEEANYTHYVKAKDDYLLHVSVDSQNRSKRERRSITTSERCSVTALSVYSGEVLWRWSDGDRRVKTMDPRFRVYALAGYAVVTTPLWPPRGTDTRLKVFDVRKRKEHEAFPDLGMLGGFQGVACQGRVLLMTGLRRGRMSLVVVDLMYGSGGMLRMRRVDWTPRGMSHTMDVSCVADDGIVVEERADDDGSEWIDGVGETRRRPLSRLCFMVMNRSHRIYGMLSAAKRLPSADMRI